MQRPEKLRTALAKEAQPPVVEGEVRILVRAALRRGVAQFPADIVGFGAMHGVAEVDRQGEQLAPDRRTGGRRFLRREWHAHALGERRGGAGGRRTVRAVHCTGDQPATHLQVQAGFGVARGRPAPRLTGEQGLADGVLNLSIDVIVRRAGQGAEVKQRVGGRKQVAEHPIGIERRPVVDPGLARPLTQDRGAGVLPGTDKEGNRDRLLHQAPRESSRKACASCIAVSRDDCTVCGLPPTWKRRSTMSRN